MDRLRGHIILCWIFTIFSISSFSQKETYNWTFGKGVGFDFTGGAGPELISHSMTSNLVYESTSTVSDADGNILFYTNGYSVWDANGDTMTGGNQTLKVGLGGTNGSACQGVTIVKHENIDNIYYVFTTDAANDATDYGFNYTTIDMSLQSGLGQVTMTTRLQDESAANFNSTEMCGVVSHSNDLDFWVVTHEYASGGSDKFLSYLVTQDGVSSSPTISSLGYDYVTKDESRGSIAFSPDGSKAAVVHHHQNWPYTNAIELYDFDDSLGSLSNLITLGNTNWNNYASGYSVIFSPDGSKLYVSFIAYSGVVQYDLSSWNQTDIKASETLVTGSSGNYGQMKIGPDAVLYKAREGSSYVSSITGDLNGAESGLTFNLNGVDLTGYGTSSFSMPNMYVKETAAALPVDLVSFEANSIDNSVVLKWTVAASINNDHFEIERSTNGVDFEKIGTVEGIGNNAGLHDFRFTDKTMKLKKNYYRLKMVDYDGKFEHSGIRMVVLDHLIANKTYWDARKSEMIIDNEFVRKGYAYAVSGLTGNSVNNGIIVDDRIGFDNLSKGIYMFEMFDKELNKIAVVYFFIN